jgi:hypothetical protein
MIQHKELAKLYHQKRDTILSILNQVEIPYFLLKESITSLQILNLSTI